MAKQKTKVDATLQDFLFSKIEGNPAYRQWAAAYKIPEYITDNLNPAKQLREYQEQALKHFIWLYNHDRDAAKHLLFNMATGSGKTLVMASIVLYLYGEGYRNFLFLVHQIQIKEQAVKNFTDYKFDKYLFNPKGIKINGQKVSIRSIENIQDSERNAINFLFFSTQLLYGRLDEDRENGLTLDDFSNHNFVIIADEAHRLNVDTRNKNKAVTDERRNWENAVLSAANARQENLLLEFTATVDLANEAIHSKYSDKLIYRYDFLQFNKDGYSKDVKFLYNREIHTEDQKRLLIVNAVALSEYRRLFAERAMNFRVTPIVLIKSTKITKSKEDREFFNKVIDSLRPEDFNRLREVSSQSKGREHEILSDMFNWIASEGSGLAGRDWDGLKAFVASIRTSFAANNTLVYNSQKKERADHLTVLDNERNTIRAIFSVNALNEGWDVLSLYDIIHFDISESKKVSLQDIQLIGRGARYCPYELPKSYKRDEDSVLSIFERSIEFDKYKRKFDNDPLDTGRVLETLVYHFVKTGTFLESLQRDLLGEGIINEGVEKKTITMKRQFLESETYKKGFVLVNRAEERTKVTSEEIDTTFGRVIKAGSYNLQARSLSDIEEGSSSAGSKYDTIRITDEYFSRPIIRKALVSAEGNFFRFNNISEHMKSIKTVDELIEKYLPLYEIQYTYEKGKSITQLSPVEKLQLLVGVILPEVRKTIDSTMPRLIGGKKFRPVSLSSIFGREKNIYLMSFPAEDPVTGKKVFRTIHERAKTQSDHDNPELRYDIQGADWYAYSENYGTGEEKRFVKYIASQIGDLRTKYKGSEIYLIRNELDYWLFNPRDGRRFSPDYMLIINDIVNGSLYYQCLIEPKGGHLLEKDAWKEEMLVSLGNNSEVVFDAEDGDKRNYREYLAEISKCGYKEIKPLGLKFYNSDLRGEADFALEFQEKLLDEKNVTP